MKIKNYNDFIFENIEPSKNLNEEYKVIAEKLEHFWQTLKMKLAEMEKINARDEDDVVIYNNNIKKGGSNATNSVIKKQPITPKLGSENKPEYKKNPEHQQEKPDPSKKVFVDETAKEGRRRKAKELKSQAISKTPKNNDDETENVEKMFNKPIKPKGLVQAK